MGQAESSRREAAGEFITVSLGEEGLNAPPSEADQLLAQLDELPSHLPLLPLAGENSWRRMLNDPEEIVTDQRGVGAINAGGLASMIAAYRDWSTRRRMEVQQKQTEVHARMVQVENSVYTSKRSFKTSLERLRASQQAIDQAASLAQEIQRLKTNLELTLVDYETLFEEMKCYEEFEQKELTT